MRKTKILFVDIDYFTFRKMFLYIRNNLKHQVTFPHTALPSKYLYQVFTMVAVAVVPLAVAEVFFMP